MPEKVGEEGFAPEKVNNLLPEKVGPEKVEKAGEAKTRTGEGRRRFPEKVAGEGSEKVPG